MKDLILVTGSEGMIGSRFIELYPEKNEVHTPRQIDFDITDKNQVKALIASYEFKAVVHFAAFTDVDEAEKQRGKKELSCWQVNVEGTKNLIEAMEPRKDKIHFIHISTDMVFSGLAEDPGPYSENHPAEAKLENLSWYGYTKSEAERVVKNKLDGRATILRLIYPVRAKFEGKLDFLRNPLTLYDEGKLYPLYSDQQISISFVDEACKAIEKMIKDNKTGVFHASSGDTTTPLEIISYMLEKTRKVKDVIAGITLEEYLKQSGDSPLRYPKYGGLSIKVTEQKLGMKVSSWHQIVDKLISQGLGQD